VISEKAANILLKTEAYGEDWPALFSRFVGFWNQLAEGFYHLLFANGGKVLFLQRMNISCVKISPF
jgi:hypothetical protein